MSERHDHDERPPLPLPASPAWTEVPLFEVADAGAKPTPFAHPKNLTGSLF